MLMMKECSTIKAMRRDLRKNVSYEAEHRAQVSCSVLGAMFPGVCRRNIRRISNGAFFEMK